MRILIVEDEPDLLRSLAQALREEGYAVDTANNGDDGLFKAESYDYDAVVLDVMLPARRLGNSQAPAQNQKDARADAHRPRPDPRPRKGLDTGADDYVVKPFDLPELFARLRALIRRSANKTTNVIEIGDVTIDTAARNVSRADKAVELTAREYALVEFLALHRGEVVTRTQLYEHLFDENDSTLSNLLDVHVSNVRKKLGHGFHRHAPRPRLLHRMKPLRKICSKTIYPLNVRLRLGLIDWLCKKVQTKKLKGKG